MKSLAIPNLLVLFASLLMAAFVPTQTQAAPYATDLTNNAGVISFRLNQTNAQVEVIYNGGGSVINLGPLPKGLIVTNLGISGSFQVRVIGVAPAGYVRISDDGFQNNGVYANKFEHPRGIAINKNP